MVIKQDEEGYYIAEVPQLKGCHTRARSLDELIERIKEAIKLCLEVYGEVIGKVKYIIIRKKGD